MQLELESGIAWEVKEEKPLGELKVIPLSVIERGALYIGMTCFIVINAYAILLVFPAASVVT